MDNKNTLSISGKLYDSDNNLLVEIKNNEWISTDNIPWDIEADYQWLKIRKKKKKIIFEINAKKSEIKLTGDLWRNGKNIHIDNKMITVGNNKNSEGVANLTLDGFTIIVDSSKEEWILGAG